MVLSGPKPWSQKRAHLLKLGLSRNVVDEMEVLSEDVGTLILRRSSAGSRSWTVAR